LRRATPRRRGKKKPRKHDLQRGDSLLWVEGEKGWPRHFAPDRRGNTVRRDSSKSTGKRGEENKKGRTGSKLAEKRKMHNGFSKKEMD